MKYTCLVPILVIFICTQCSVPLSGPQILDSYPNGAKKTEMVPTDINGRYHLYRYYQTGELESSLILTQTGLNGSATDYFKSGAVRSKYNFVEGLVSGTMENYYENGNLKAELEFLNDVKVGIFKLYHRDGWLERMGQYTDVEEYDGDHNEYHLNIYYQNGSMKSKGLVVNEEYQGPVKYYRENGTIENITQFLNDVPTNCYSLFNEDENLWKEATCVDESCVKANVVEYDENGALISSYIERERVITGWVKYFVDEVLESEIYYEHGKRNGPYKVYFIDGTIKEDGSLTNGEYDGTIRKYYKNGALRNRAMYSSGKLHGIAEQFSETGKLISRQNFVNGQFVE